jgi:GTP cyclohydrolase II
MTNRPRRVASLEGYGIEIVAQIPIASSQTHGFDSREAQEIVNDNRIVSYV